jgi:RNA polymerase sigma factor (sigma-70 family)
MDTESDTARGAAREDLSADLVQRIRAGDPLAEEELVNNYRRGLLVIATVRTRDREAAQDLAQEILIAVLKALRDGQLREAQKLGAFIQGTARNLINNYLRLRSRRPESDLDSIQEPSTDPVEDLESADRLWRIRQELENFSPVDQQILLLSLVDGHSLLEVAKRCKMSHDAVRARRSRMIRKITKKFGGVSHE